MRIHDKGDCGKRGFVNIGCSAVGIHRAKVRSNPHLKRSSVDSFIVCFIRRGL